MRYKQPTNSEDRATQPMEAGGWVSQYLFFYCGKEAADSETEHWSWQTQLVSQVPGFEASCLRQRSSFVLRGGNPQFGSRKFPHSVCLQSHCGACGRRQASGRATLYTRHQTIRLTAGLTCACYILPLLFNSTATNLGGKYHQQFLSPTLGKQSTNNKNSTSYNYAKLAKLEGI